MHTHMIALLKRFKRDEDAAVFIIVGFLIVILVAIGGAGVDFARSEIIRHKMHQAIDAAALAGASMPPGTDEADRRAAIDRYFRMNFPDGYMGSDITPVNLLVTFVPNGTDPQSINIKLSDEVDTQFISLVGTEMLRINSETEVSVSGTSSEIDMDVVMVLDVSGSMDATDSTGRRKIDSLRLAAESLVNTLVDPISPNDKLRIGVIVYATLNRELMFSSNYDDLMGEINKIGNGSLGVGSNTYGGDASQTGANLILNPPARADGLTGATKIFMFLTDGAFNDPDNNPANGNQQKDKFRNQCDRMESDGVIKYTFAFGLDAETSHLRDCATDPVSDYFKYADNGDDLIDSFTVTAEEVDKIRLVK